MYFFGSDHEILFYYMHELYQHEAQL